MSHRTQHRERGRESERERDSKRRKDDVKKVHGRYGPQSTNEEELDYWVFDTPKLKSNQKFLRSKGVSFVLLQAQIGKYLGGEALLVSEDVKLNRIKRYGPDLIHEYEVRLPLRWISY